MSTGFAPTEELTKQDVLTLYDDGDHDLFAHVVPKLAFGASDLRGHPAIALCGKRWLPTKDEALPGLSDVQGDPGHLARTRGGQ